MAYIQAEGRHQGSLFPVVLDDLVPADHMCRVIDAFIARLALFELGFERARAGGTGRGCSLRQRDYSRVLRPILRVGNPAAP
jgi:hypothetical protein